MSAAAQQQGMTAVEYLAFDRQQPQKFEYVDGEVHAMTGASLAHVRIVGNLHAYLHTALADGPCRVLMSDMRVRADQADAYFYPDLSLYCGAAELADDEGDTLLNPLVVIEVLSPSTERFDRGRKFELYRQLPSLREYWLVAQDRPHVETFQQIDGRWSLTEASDLEAVLALRQPPLSIPLAAIYADVDLAR